MFFPNRTSLLYAKIDDSKLDSEAAWFQNVRELRRDACSRPLLLLPLQTAALASAIVVVLESGLSSLQSRRQFFPLRNGLFQCSFRLVHEPGLPLGLTRTDELLQFCLGAD